MTGRQGTLWPMLAVLLSGVIAGCSSEQGSPARVAIANPAAEYCIKLGGRLTQEQDAAGNAHALCYLPDGSVMEEWALFRRDHAGAE